tara:strand:+ start:154 stop:864 length:711 start_codon:yes stop_codon:yes gene_type:complete
MATDINSLKDIRITKLDIALDIFFHPYDFYHNKNLNIDWSWFTLLVTFISVIIGLIIFGTMIYLTSSMFIIFAYVTITLLTSLWFLLSISIVKVLCYFTNNIISRYGKFNVHNPNDILVEYQELHDILGTNFWLVLSEYYTRIGGVDGLDTILEEVKFGSTHTLLDCYLLYCLLHIDHIKRELVLGSNCYGNEHYIKAGIRKLEINFVFYCKGILSKGGREFLLSYGVNLVERYCN